jgi:predicted PurR-regulated permease PerM
MRIRTVENVSFLALVLLVTVAFVLLVWGFMQPIFWAAVLGILFAPTYRRLHARLGGRGSLASSLTLVLVVLVVILPLIGIGAAVTNEAVLLYDRVATGELDVTAPVRMVEGWMPRAAELLGRFDVDLDGVREAISNAAMTASRYAAQQALALGQSALQVLVMFILMLYLLFFFLRDGNRIVEAFIRALPLGDVRERRLLARFAEVSRATIKGTLIVGIVQGSLGGLAFWALGLGAPVLWGVVMALLSMLPAVGSFLVWGPAAVYLFATGSIVKSLVLVALGSLLIGTIDNVLRPILVGRDTQLPDYLILLSTLGGIVVFGISGFVLGPIVAGLFVTVWEMFVEEFEALDDPGVPPDVTPPDEGPPTPPHAARPNENAPAAVLGEERQPGR